MKIEWIEHVALRSKMRILYSILLSLIFGKLKGTSYTRAPENEYSKRKNISSLLQ